MSNHSNLTLNIVKCALFSFKIPIIFQRHKRKPCQLGLRFIPVFQLLMSLCFRMKCLRTLFTIPTTSGCPCISPSLPSSSIFQDTFGSKWKEGWWNCLEREQLQGDNDKGIKKPSKNVFCKVHRRPRWKERKIGSVFLQKYS